MVIQTHRGGGRAVFGWCKSKKGVTYDYGGGILGTVWF